MTLSIINNLSANKAQHALARTQNSLAKTFERLSTGKRINCAGDDAAGLAISTLLTSQIRGLGVAEKNANDAISMVTMADGAMSTIQTNLLRMRDLAVASSNGSASAAQRTSIQTEMDQCIAEISRISNSTSFNGINLLDGTAGSSGGVTFQIGANQDDSNNSQTVNVTFAAMDSSTLGVEGIDATVQDSANAAISTIDLAVAFVSAAQSTLGASSNRLQIAVDNLETAIENTQAANIRVLDADIAVDVTNMSSQQVLARAGASVLSQANQAPQLALQLLQ